MKVVYWLSVCMAILAVSSPGAVVTGSIWIVAPEVSQNAIPANVPATTPDIIFDVDSPLSFSIDESGATNLGAFLASGGAFNIVENTPGVLASDSNDILMELTGFVSVTNGQVFSAAHDDGLTLTIGGINLGFSPLPTSPTVSDRTYTGPSGNFPFQLVYGECCSGPAVLIVELEFGNIPGSLPEPSTWSMVLGGTVAAVVLRRRRAIRGFGGGRR
jgi:hypothetical protein